MVFELSVATESDAAAIASLHLTAFASNILLHAQFPTQASLQALEKFLSQDTIRDLRDPRKTVLVARDSVTRDILSFAKWDFPGSSRDCIHVKWPDGSREGCLNAYYDKAVSAKERVVGNNPCYCLTLIGTHPDFQDQGAGTMLTEWGLEKARSENVPVYLDSTVLASSLFRRLGFVALDGISMTLPGRAKNGGPIVYEGLSMLRTWADEAQGMDYWDSSLNISSLKEDYNAGIKPQLVVQAIYDRIETYKDIQPSVWIYLHPIGDVMRAANELLTRWPNETERPPLWGIPFSVKDNINIEGIPTTAGCPALAFTPESSASVYQCCIDAGGLFIGKTNMEQLATGMTGCRSPYGTLHSTFSQAHIVGGSSSGSSVTVSEGLVSFSLGTDTAGSIRLPALFNGIFGFKPTKGTISARGVSPACLHQDCVSFLTLNPEDADIVWQVCKGFDKGDYFAKLPCHSEHRAQPSHVSFRFGIPTNEALEACSTTYRRQFRQVTDALQKAGGKLVSLDWAPFSAANELLYNSSFVAERLTIFPEGWFEDNKDLLHPVTKQVFEGALARKDTAVDLFRDLHRQAAYKRAVEGILSSGDQESGEYELTLMVVPTAPFHPTIEEVGEDPIGINEKLGTFAHFANVLDLVGVALPCGTYEIGEEGNRKQRLPFGVTILAGTGLDRELLDLAKGLEEVLGGLGQDE